ncbi:MAG: hypothetical protein ONB44_03030 [candidate division KSB1 bacterium]|nr:hypothetical protein [candidate division KSB1 bacterium]MDZ7301100.1 hypothetical protein [candidate division KSB1 bacterium]MDZ7312015.1 hypothetical protein [candidate division KSB1 bacterium]
MSRDKPLHVPQGDLLEKSRKNNDRKKSDFLKTEEEVEFPLRQPHDSKKFFLFLGVFPALFTVLVAFFFAWLLFPEISTLHLLAVAFVHFLALVIFWFLLWLHAFLAVRDWPEWIEMTIVTLRSVLLVGIAVAVFPNSLLLEFIDIAESQRPLWLLNKIFCVVFVLIYVTLAYLNNRKTAIRDIRMASSPQHRKHQDRWVWFEAISFFLVLFAVIVIESWFLAAMSKGKLDFSPYERLTRAYGRIVVQNILSGAENKDNPRQDSVQPLFRRDSITTPLPDTSQTDIPRSAAAFSLSSNSTIDSTAGTSITKTQQERQAQIRKFVLKHRLTKLSWLCCSILCALIFFLWACLPNRLLKATLIPVTFHERDVQGVLFKSHRYLFHFIWAMLLKHPYLLIGGVILTLFFHATPAILTSAGRTDILDKLFAADEIILALGVFIAWFTPISLAAVKPDETFGEYFNLRLANHIMMVQGHLVFIGFGDLGKRVLDREINQMHSLQGKDRRKKMFLEIVTPDLRLEQLCSHAVVIEHNPKDVIYSGQNPLLGNYGVVSTYQRRYRSRDPHGNIVHAERRVLVPVVIGEAKEPFISSRVNLERASLVISMVPDEESVQAVFERAVKASVCSIICVTRSDQISYLTYRSRHRPIVLVYPKHNQGLTLGQRLWAAILKVRAVRKMADNIWPKVLVIGNNKANHYMLETLWTNLPGDHKQRHQILQKNFAFVVTEPDDPLEYPKLKDPQKKDTYDQQWPATYITGGRYPYPSKQVSQTEPLHVPTRVVNAADISALETCLADHQPDILVMNHEDVDKSLLMLSRCVRALERLKTSQPTKFKLPLLLLSAARGNELEQLSLGDASRYYDALCKLHQEDLADDTSYPSHARYHHLLREVIGETISDSYADTEEIISGARNSFLDPAKPQFVEINGCLPNRPGTLANYVAKLAGIDFMPQSKAQIDTLWRQANQLSAIHGAYVPSFQYLRNIMLDPERMAFALTGYASLAPLTKDSPAVDVQSMDHPLIIRIFANDGRDYVEPEIDQDEWQSLKEELPQLMEWRKPGEPEPPGIPDVIDRVSGRTTGAYNSVGAFRQVLLDPQPGNSLGRFACPGMTICRIAAFQDYVVASNSKRLQRQAMVHSNCSPWENLLHARNYYCSTKMRQATGKEVPQPDTPFARLFCCCRGSHDPGMIAMVLNTFLFRSNFTRQAATGDPSKDWVINIDYFKDISCQNPYFTLNRLFGSYAKKPPVAESGEPLSLPLHLLRILPIGAMDSARQWFYYARTLHYFLNSLEATSKYKFYWHDEKLNRWDGSKVPKFREKPRRDFPVVLVIKRERSDEERKADPNKFCHLCGVQPKDYDCRRLRVWV